ncbi:ABC transporter substrate-binding protein [Salinibacterium sp. G-O1]|uniref:ABC transporter substrate-binding protein n=1 Tax=Salinibacterium sp. G-O1 TaxID=3046208 RepID=UPI0024B91575|nr:ABC transporter substrate-binding protein [Salinibacterium sp. G-O1]MDJ0336298.1 ABC transporter substrate-binding protein [Salinibacterium sp. G-O1]
MRTSRRTIAAVVAGAAAITLVATGCASSGDGAAADPNEKITLTLATFNDFGYSDEMLAQYTETHPNITIVHNKAATSNDARDNFFTKLGAGSGLADVEAIEVDWLAEIMQYSDKLTDLSSPEVDGRWVEWKTASATDPDGRLVGYGTDIGPEAVCYRADLLKAAGLPSEPAEVAALLDGDWDNYYSVGQQYVDATGNPWFDSAGATYQGVINQVENAYEENDGTVIATENPEVEEAFTSVLEASSTLSAHLGQWSDDWSAGLANGSFATMLCPGWMLGVISGNAPEIADWNIANVFPGGGGNWGGSYLTVPAQGKHPKEAQEFAAWLTAPEQQLQAFTAAGTFPSQVATYSDPALLESTDEFFNNAPVGQIFSDRSEAITVTPFKSVKYFPINDALQKSLTRVDVDKSQSISDSWAQFVADVKALG